MTITEYTANFGKLMEQKVLHLLNITNKTVNKKEQKWQ